MVSVTLLIRVAAATMVSTTAFAADMPQPMPPPMQYQPIVMEQPASAWYLRGDIGVGITNKFDVTYLPSPPDVGNGFAFDQHSNGDTVFINAGIGYEFNNWLRFDVTGTYRSKTDVNAFGSYSFPGGGTFGDSYHGYLQSWIALANAYIDLGTWDCLTPFVGAGIGGAYNKMADLTDVGIGTSGRGIGLNSSEWHAAYALYAGLTYNVTQSFKVDLSYRYLNYGSVTDTINCIGGCNPDSYKFGSLSSQDLMLGVRFLLQPEATPVAMPISTRG